MTAGTTFPQQPLRTPLRVRLGAALHRGALDRRLIDGEAPDASPEIGRRAERLLDPGERREIAEALHLTIAATLDPRRGQSSKVSLNRAEIEAARPELEALCEALESEHARSPRGAAMARSLVTDIASPLYSPCAPGELAAAARHARIALLLR